MNQSRADDFTDLKNYWVTASFYTTMDKLLGLENKLRTGKQYDVI